MAKTDNLTDLLTDVADAIREKKGTNEKINPQNFSEEIRSIEGGGGIAPCEWNDVNFYDYEGTILYSYTWDEFVEKNEMPPLPTHHKGLVCQGWNYTLEEVLEQGGRCDVGAIYDTVDGAARIKIAQGGGAEYTICLKASVIGGAEIHWGDGSVSTSTSTDLAYYSHIYADAGSFVIRVTAKSGTIDSFGVINLMKTYQSLEDVNIGRNIASLCDEAFRYCLLTKISLPESLEVRERCFLSAYYGERKVGIAHINIPRVLSGSFSQLCEGATSLRSVSMPNTDVQYNQFMFSGIKELRHLHIPSNAKIPSLSMARSLITITSSPKNTFLTTQGNIFVVEGKIYAGGQPFKFPMGVKVIASEAFSYNDTLIEIDIPDSVTNIGSGAFNYCRGIKRITLPQNITTIEADSFGRLESLTSPIKIPAYVSMIKNYSFSGTYNLPYFDFRWHTFVPTLSNAAAFSSSGSWKIIVPDNLYDQWITATNWSSLASRIVKAGEYVEQ